MDIKVLAKRIKIGVVSLVTTIGSMLAPGAVIFGGGYTLLEYNDKQKTWHEERALELYKKQLEDPLLEHRIALDVFYDRKWREKYLIAVKGNRSDNSTLLKNFTDDFSKNKSKEILILTNFYEGVVDCVTTKICDELTTRSLFEDDIKEFVLLFTPFFCQLRQDLKDDTIASKLVTFYPAKKNDSKELREQRDSKLCPKNDRPTVAHQGEKRDKAKPVSLAPL